MAAVYPGMSSESHPELFNIMPTQPAVKKPGQLPEEKIKEYFEKLSVPHLSPPLLAPFRGGGIEYLNDSDSYAGGRLMLLVGPPKPDRAIRILKCTDGRMDRHGKTGFLIVEDFFKPEELEPCKETINEIVDDVAQMLYDKGKIKNLYKEYGFEDRLIKVNDEFPGANVLVIKTGKLSQAFRNLWSNERLLNVIEQLIGPEIAGSPVWNIRAKTPLDEATVVPWHQDVSYMDKESYKMFIPSAWIPFVDANQGNGCLEFVSKGHKTGKVATHQCCHGGTWYTMIEEDEMEKTLGVDMSKDVQLCSVPYGGMILFSNIIPHRSIPNVSSKIRWSADLRWQHPDNPTGLWGLKDSVLLRSAKNPDLVINWDKFDSVDRATAQKEKVVDMIPPEEDPQLDTTITGPWMKMWEITHINRHVKVNA